MPSPGTLFIISAPSGAGKTSLVNALVQRCDTLKVSVSHTTRPKRSREEDGRSYHFVSEATFADMLSQGLFLEHARVFDNLYGTSRDWVDGQLAAGCDIILEIDWQGAAQIKRLRPDSVSVFILPPSRQALLQRLTGRGQDDETVIRQRMDAAVEEISHHQDADYIVVNDDFDQALDELQSVIDSQRLDDPSPADRLRSPAQIARHRQLLDDLLPSPAPPPDLPGLSDLPDMS